MKFKIPFTVSDTEKLKSKSKRFSKIFRNYDDSGYLYSYLRYCNAPFSPSEYLGICLRKFIIHFFSIFVFSFAILFFFNIGYIYSLFIGLGISVLFSSFAFFMQIGYPKMRSSRKDKDIEKNLISALQDMLVQLKSGVSLYDTISNLSRSNYGSASDELGKAVSRISGGVPQIRALEGLISDNNSSYFKRVLWQLSNGLRSGSKMTVVINDSIENMQKEQELQIQTYGNKLNPLVMFYMLIAVIIPSLGITFLIIISSMIGLPSDTLKMVFVGVFVFIVLIQIMFLGIIKSKRPSLL